MKQMITSILLVCFWIGLYFTPYFIANARNHKQRDGIMVLNLLLGWTGLGWIAALIWAVI